MISQESVSLRLTRTCSPDLNGRLLHISVWYRKPLKNFAIRSAFCLFIMGGSIQAGEAAGQFSHVSQVLVGPTDPVLAGRLHDQAVLAPAAPC
jgi:hypothetical protein